MTSTIASLTAPQPHINRKHLTKHTDITVLMLSRNLNLCPSFRFQSFLCFSFLSYDILEEHTWQLYSELISSSCILNVINSINCTRLIGIFICNDRQHKQKSTFSIKKNKMWLYKHFHSLMYVLFLTNPVSFFTTGLAQFFKVIIPVTSKLRWPSIPNFSGQSRILRACPAVPKNIQVIRDAELSRIPNPVPNLSHLMSRCVKHQAVDQNAVHRLTFLTVSSVELKTHQIHFWPVLCPRPHWHRRKHRGGMRGTHPPQKSQCGGRQCYSSPPPRFWPLKTWKTAKFSPNIHQNPIFFGALPRTPLGELTALPQTH